MSKARHAFKRRIALTIFTNTPCQSSFPDKNRGQCHYRFNTQRLYIYVYVYTGIRKCLLPAYVFVHLILNVKCQNILWKCVKFLIWFGHAATLRHRKTTTATDQQATVSLLSKLTSELVILPGNAFCQCNNAFEWHWGRWTRKTSSGVHSLHIYHIYSGAHNLKRWLVTSQLLMELK